MGTPDYVGNDHLQIKSTPDPKMNHYSIGDKIEIPNGLHLTHEGWFVVHGGKVFITGLEIWDKWGNELDPCAIIEPNNPIGLALKDRGLVE